MAIVLGDSLALGFIKGDLFTRPLASNLEDTRRYLGTAIGTIFVIDPYIVIDVGPRILTVVFHNLVIDLRLKGCSKF